MANRESSIPSGDFSILPYSQEYKPLKGKFSCGNEDLDDYLKRYAWQDVKKRVSSLFVALSPGKDSIAGFYTLSMHSVKISDLPKSIGSKLPGYPRVGVVLLGRLAVDLNFRKLGLGESLLMDGMSRSLGSEVAWWAMVVDAKEGSEGFYSRYGFIPFKDSKERLFLPRKTIERAFG